MSDNADPTPTGKLAVLGAGSWGTALALTLFPRFGEVAVWCHNPERAVAMQEGRENSHYLPGFPFPDGLRVSSNPGVVLRSASFVLSVVPSEHLRNVLSLVAPSIPREAPIISATKGLEEHTLRRMSEVVQACLPPERHRPAVVLSGPTFAREIAAGEPAAMVVASEDSGAAERVQWALSTPKLRLYASTDTIGVELSGALKNVIAIGAGVCHGLGLGSNTVAALITRGLAEMTRLAVSMGGSARTLSGLAGLGDLILTATGDLSRNRSVGIRLGQGQMLPAILDTMTMVAEGVKTTQAAFELGQQRHVELPIINQIHAILYEGRDPSQAIAELMDRPLRTE